MHELAVKKKEKKKGKDLRPRRDDESRLLARVSICSTHYTRFVRAVLQSVFNPLAPGVSDRRPVMDALFLHLQIRKHSFEDADTPLSRVVSRVLDRDLSCVILIVWLDFGIA